MTVSRINDSWEIHSWGDMFSPMLYSVSGTVQVSCSAGGELEFSFDSSYDTASITKSIPADVLLQYLSVAESYFIKKNV